MIIIIIIIMIIKAVVINFKIYFVHIISIVSCCHINKTYYIILYYI